VGKGRYGIKVAQGNPKLLNCFNPCGTLRLTDSLRQ
jgi:hypothetical protein